MIILRFHLVTLQGFRKRFTPDFSQLSTTKKQHLDSVEIDPKPLATVMLYHKHSRRYNRLYHPNVFEEICLKVPMPKTIENPYHMHWGQLNRWTCWPWFASGGSIRWANFIGLQAPFFSDVTGPRCSWSMLKKRIKAFCHLAEAIVWIFQASRISTGYSIFNYQSINNG